jgi:GH25 family lysozyme M1 (1,4-beta-N-acetylmuramidase)
MSKFSAPPLDAARGVDVSKYQAKVDHAAVAAEGYTFAVVRVADGVKYLDAYHAANVAGFEGAGLAVAHYHYFRAGVSVVDQLKVVTDRVPRGAVVAHDLETRDKQAAWTVLSRASDWCIGAREAGLRPILYTMPSFLDALHKDTACDPPAPWSVLGDLDLWIAHWIRVPKPGVARALGRDDHLGRAPSKPAGWTRSPLAWQYVADAIVPGIAGPMDVNLWYGSENSMRAYLKGETV